jgi:hypothetical protein
VSELWLVKYPPFIKNILVQQILSDNKSTVKRERHKLLKKMCKLKRFSTSVFICLDGKKLLASSNQSTNGQHNIINLQDGPNAFRGLFDGK